MSLLDMILERELTPEQREAKRLRAKARREKRREQTGSSGPDRAAAQQEPSRDVKSEPDPDSSVEISTGFLRVQWRKYNEKYFGSELREPKLFIPKSGKGSMGQCTHDYDPRGNEVYCEAIRINDKIENYQTFRNTMVHEMVHQWAYQQLGETDIRSANMYGMARSRKWWNALTRPMGRDGHHGTWLQKCEELTAKFPYLKLTKYGQRDELELDGEEKTAAVEAAKGNHVVLCEPGGGRHKYFYYITDNGFQELKRDIEAGKKSGRWIEYVFDPEKIAKEKLTPVSHAGNSAYKGSYLEDLIERGVVSQRNSKPLGGEKSTVRRSRSSWF
jgi:L-rhamnose mutarotase